MQKIIISGMRQLLDAETANSEDTAKTLSTLGFTVSRAAGAEGGNDRPIDQAIIYVGTNDIRMGKGAITTSLGVLVEAGDVIHLQSAKEIIDTKFISAVAGSHADLHVQAGFDN